MTEDELLQNVRGQAQLSRDGDAEAHTDSAGQSGDAQGLSQSSGAAEESVKELAEADQTYEADVELGVEDAADHTECPVPIREGSGL